MHRCNRFQDNTTRKSSEDMDSIEQCIGYTYNRNCDEQSKSVESLKEQDEESDNDQLVIDEGEPTSCMFIYNKLYFSY